MSDISISKQVPVEVFSRVVGYYRPLDQWHKGKQAEFNDRVYFKVPEECISGNKG